MCVRKRKTVCRASQMGFCETVTPQLKTLPTRHDRRSDGRRFRLCLQCYHSSTAIQQIKHIAFTMNMGDASVNSTSSGGWQDDDRTVQRILGQASAQELRKAGNLAYLDLREKYVKLQGQFEGQKKHLDDLRLIIRNPLVASAARPQPGNTPSPAECDQDDSENVKCQTDQGDGRERLQPSTTIPPFVSKAGAPFDKEKADVVLRSADGIDFHIFKGCLLIVSDVFGHMFLSPQPEPGNEEEELANGLRVVPVYDHSHVLRVLLCYCGSYWDRSIDLWTGLRSVLIDVQNLAMKYKMITVARDVYRDRIRLGRKPPSSHMLDVIRRQVKQNADMYSAATNIFICSEEAAEMVDLGIVNQAQLDSLVRYRDKCCARAVAVASPENNHFTWMSPEYNWFTTDIDIDIEHDRNCSKGGSIYIANVSGKSRTRYWWREYMYEAARRLAKRPWGATVTSEDFFDQALGRSRCRVCKEGLDRDFRQFTELFAREIDKAVSEVVLEKL